MFSSRILQHQSAWSPGAMYMQHSAEVQHDLSMHTEYFKHMRRSVRAENSKHTDTNPVHLLRGVTALVQMRIKQIASSIGRDR